MEEFLLCIFFHINLRVRVCFVQLSTTIIEQQVPVLTPEQ